MKIIEILDQGVLKFSIEGDLDANSAITMDNAMRKAYSDSNYQILIDCSLLNYISSAGLGVFISYHDDFKEHEGDFVFFEMNENVYSIFELLGLHNIFNIVDDENTARNLLS